MNVPSPWTTVLLGRHAAPILVGASDVPVGLDSLVSADSVLVRSSLYVGNQRMLTTIEQCNMYKCI